MMKQFIWYEKYRQKKLEKLVLPKKHKKFFNKCIKEGEIPHLLFIGPYGSGKTTLALILLHSCASTKLVLNASSYDRGINIVKTKVKDFAKSSTLKKDKTNIVLFDEADGMTHDAQEALKNTIETYQKNCRFIFTANRIERVHGAIQSRCQIWEFQSLGFIHVLELACYILENEGIKYRKPDLRKYCKENYPDIRSIINILQQNSSTGKLIYDKKIDDKQVLSEYIKKGLINAARSTWSGTADFHWLYLWLFEKFIYEVKKKKRPQVALTIAEYMYRDRLVIDSEINAMACLLEIMNILEIEVDFETPF